MKRNLHTTDETGFDYMANSGQEEKDRDACGTIIAVLIMTALVALQYWGVY